MFEHTAKKQVISAYWVPISKEFTKIENGIELKKRESVNNCGSGGIIDVYLSPITDELVCISKNIGDNNSKFVIA